MIFHDSGQYNQEANSPKVFQRHQLAQEHETLDETNVAITGQRGHFTITYNCSEKCIV